MLHSALLNLQRNVSVNEENHSPPPRREYRYARGAGDVRLRYASAPPPPSGPARGLNLTTAYNSGRTNGHGATGATATSLEF